MEIIDRAQEEVERQLERSLQLARNQSVKYHAIGHCLNCEEPLADGMRWCDSDCRDDFLKWENRGK
ncbi:hypothetical protein [Proteus phage vB_PmiM_ZX7]|nr:hypothetical protein [Proteus phage vB_PmiM_ZX7]